MGYDDYKKRSRNTKKETKGGDTDPSSSQGHEAITAKPLEVKVYGNNFDKALRAFRALVQKERVLSFYKEKQTYEKPSDKKRRKKSEAKRKRMENEE